MNPKTSTVMRLQCVCCLTVKIALKGSLCIKKNLFSDQLADLEYTYLCKLYSRFIHKECRLKVPNLYPSLALYSFDIILPISLLQLRYSFECRTIMRIFDYLLYLAWWQAYFDSVTSSKMCKWTQRISRNNAVQLSD